MKIVNVQVISAKVNAEVELGEGELQKLGLIVDNSALERLALEQVQEQAAAIADMQQARSATVRTILHEEAEITEVDPLDEQMLDEDKKPEQI